MATAVAPASAMVWLNDRGSQVTALWLAIDPAVTAVDMAWPHADSMDQVQPRCHDMSLGLPVPAAASLSLPIIVVNLPLRSAVMEEGFRGDRSQSLLVK